MLHTVMVPPVPAFGAITTATDTVADACVQGGAASTTYVYNPGGSFAGSNTPFMAPRGPHQLPVVSGEPGITLKSWIGPLLEQTVNTPLSPALAGCTVVMGSTYAIPT